MKKKINHDNQNDNKGKESNNSNQNNYSYQKSNNLPSKSTNKQTNDNINNSKKQSNNSFKNPQSKQSSNGKINHSYQQSKNIDKPSTSSNKQTNDNNTYSNNSKKQSNGNKFKPLIYETKSQNKDIQNSIINVLEKKDNTHMNRKINNKLAHEKPSVTPNKINQKKKSIKDRRKSVDKNLPNEKQLSFSKYNFILNFSSFFQFINDKKCSIHNLCDNKGIKLDINIYYCLCIKGNNFKLQTNFVNEFNKLNLDITKNELGKFLSTDFLLSFIDFFF